MSGMNSLFALASLLLTLPSAAAATFDLAQTSADWQVINATRILASGDIDGDGRADLLARTSDQYRVALILSKRFTAAQPVLDLETDGADCTFFEGSSYIRQVDMVDLDRDRIADLVFTISVPGSTGYATRLIAWKGSSNWPAEIDLMSDRPTWDFGETPNYFAKVVFRDVNNDSLIDLVIGVPSFNCPRSGTVWGGGAVFLFWEHDAGGRLIASLTHAFDEAESVICSNCPDHGVFGFECPLFGDKVAVGDFDGDRRQDLAIAAPWSQQTAAHTGLIHLLHGTPSSQPFPRRTDVTPFGGTAFLEGPLLEYHMPSADMDAADVDGDGRDELLVLDHFGWTLADPRSRTYSGQLRVLRTGLPGSPRPAGTVRLSATPPEFELVGELRDTGWSMAFGDLDGDQRADLLVGLSGGDGPNNSRPTSPLFAGSGDVVIVRGSRASGTLDLKDTEPTDVIYGAQPGEPDCYDYGRNGDGVGNSVALADVDGDGHDDALIGAPAWRPFGWPPCERRPGSVFVIRGSRLLSTAPLD